MTGGRGGDERVEGARLMRDGWQLVQPEVLRAESRPGALGSDLEAKEAQRRTRVVPS